MYQIQEASSAEEALELLQVFQQENGEQAFFRGEPANYEDTATAIERIDPSIRSSISNNLIPNLSLHMWQQRLGSFLTHDYGIVTFENEPFGAKDLANGGDDMEPHNINWGFYGLMQHYGIPTNWLDITRSPEVALYFASLANGKKQGVVYYGGIENFYNNGNVVDLAVFAKLLRRIIPVEITRPERQKALAVRVLSNSNFRSFVRCVRFPKKHNVDGQTEHYFPKDALKVWIMGQVVDYWLDFRTRVTSMKKTTDENVIWHEQALRDAINHLNLY